MVFTVAGYRVGGKPGESPTWLVATIFYTGDKYLLSPRGDFDKRGLSEKIQEATSTVSEYKLVLGIDVVLPSIESVHSILSFLGEFKIPIFIDAASPEVRARGYLAAKELGLAEYSIANGIYVDSPLSELEALRESRIGKAVLVAFDPKNPYELIAPDKRIALLEDRLEPLAEKAGVELAFVDFVVLDPGSIALCGEAIRAYKERSEYPAGCAPANALGSVTRQDFTLEELCGVHGGSAAYLRMMGADFVMIGPLGRVKYVAPVLAMVDGLLGYSLRRRGVKIPDEHPLKGLLRRVQKHFTQPVLPGTA